MGRLEWGCPEDLRGLRVRLWEQGLHLASTHSMLALVVAAVLRIFLDLRTLTAVDGMLFLEAIMGGTRRLQEQLLTWEPRPRAQSLLSRGRLAPLESLLPETSVLLRLSRGQWGLVAVCLDGPLQEVGHLLL